jgi:hypothetical protein
MSKTELSKKLGNIGLSEQRDLVCRARVKEPFDVEVSRGFLMFTYSLSNFFASTIPFEEPNDEGEEVTTQQHRCVPEDEWKLRLADFVEKAGSDGLGANAHLTSCDLNGLQWPVSQLINGATQLFAFAHEFGHIILSFRSGEEQSRASAYLDKFSSPFTNGLHGTAWRERWAEELSCDILAFNLMMDYGKRGAAFGLGVKPEQASKVSRNQILRYEEFVAEAAKILGEDDFEDLEEAGSIRNFIQSIKKLARKLPWYAELNTSFFLSITLCGMDLLLVGLQIIEEQSDCRPSPTHPPASLRRLVLLELVHDRGLCAFHNNFVPLLEDFATTYIAPLLGNDHHTFSISTI